MDTNILFPAAATAMMIFLYYHHSLEKGKVKGRLSGTKQRRRVRRSVESVRNEIGDALFRRSYRMSFESFQELHRILQPALISIHKELMEAASSRRREKRRMQTRSRRPLRTKWKRFVHNGSIHTSVRLAIALRFFAGGSMYDMAPLYGVGRTDAFASVWMVVDAVHRTLDLRLVFPENHDDQRRLAREFSRRSQALFDCCVGAVDGILIWVLQPTPSCCKESHCEAKKFSVGGNTSLVSIARLWLIAGASS